VGAEDALRGALRRLGATPRDVVAVFLTHAHRDHVAAWRAVAHAPFYVGRGEAARLYGVRPHGGWIPRLADVLLAPRLPRPGEVTARELGRDTAIVLGADTVLAYVTPGHTEGSVAYLLRGVLFVGDGASHAWGGGLRAARRGYSDDVALAAASLARLRRATAGHAPRLACTAHARCAPAGRWPLDR
jgi:glyoxylase-like metal-dependent hydrolase (beta-lactamase superfamily II)